MTTDTSDSLDHDLAKGFSEWTLLCDEPEEEKNLARCYLALAAERDAAHEALTAQGDALRAQVATVSTDLMTAWRRADRAEAALWSAKVLDHKWLDAGCIETGCQSLVWKHQADLAEARADRLRAALEEICGLDPIFLSLHSPVRKIGREALHDTERKEARDDA